MSGDFFRDVYVLTGPTASGKSRLGMELAERLGAEIVSMDSMALYRGMDIGTAKPEPELRRRVPHHLLDVLDPWESASVAWWLQRAAECCEQIRARGRRVLFVGGTPLYLKALVYGLFDGPPADPQLRRRLEDEANEKGKQALHERLAHVDPVTASRLHPNDLRRVVRALEVFELTGRPISQWQQQWSVVRGPWSVVRGEQTPATATEATDNGQRTTDRFLWLDLPRAVLYERIDRRVEEMVRAGLVEEAEALLRLPKPLSREAAQALGYKEMFEHLAGRATLAETVRRVQQRSRNFAKRQVTWFRHLAQCQPISPELTFAAWGLTTSENDGRFNKEKQASPSD